MTHRVAKFINRHQVPITRNILVALYCAEFVARTYFPQWAPYTARFLHVLHVTAHDQGSVYYDIGSNDAYYIAYYVVLLTFLRAVLMQYVFMPFADYVVHIKLRTTRMRFAEQSWQAAYYTYLFLFGQYLYYRSPYWSNINSIFAGWPHDRMTLLFKKYYLILTAFWLHQVVTLHIEKRRKDHVQMLCHHVVTCALVIGLYYYYYSRIGNLILIIMDSVDILLLTAKVLKYMGFTRACDAMFGLFVVTWIVLRHGVYNYLFYIAWHRSTTLMEGSQCVAGLVQKRCWNSYVVNSFLGLLGGLQVISLVWLYMIVKIIIKVVRGQNAEDLRSDEESE